MVVYHQVKNSFLKKKKVAKIQSFKSNIFVWLSLISWLEIVAVGDIGDDLKNLKLLIIIILLFFQDIFRAFRRQHD